MSNDIDDRPNNWLASRDSYENDPDLYECTKCGQHFPSSLIDDDAGEAFEPVCRECADKERAEAQAEDAAWRDQRDNAARAIGSDFDKWWGLEGEFHWQQMHWRMPAGLAAMHPREAARTAARETARLAWLAGAVKGVQAGGEA